MIIVQSAPLCSFHNFMFFTSDLNTILFLIRKSLKNFERNTILFQKFRQNLFFYYSRWDFDNDLENSFPDGNNVR